MKLDNYYIQVINKDNTTTVKQVQGKDIGNNIMCYSDSHQHYVLSDILTGRSIVDGNRKKNIINRVLNGDLKDKIKEVRKSPKYEEEVKRFNEMMRNFKSN